MKTLLILLLSVVGAMSAFAVSGDQNSIQRAIDSTPAGGTVTIDNGNWNWTGGQTITINKAIKVLGASRSGCKINIGNGTVDNIRVTEPPSGVTELGNFTLNWVKAENVWPFPISVHPANPRTTGRVLLHDLYTTTNYAYAVLWDTNGGVIYNCTFDGTNSGGLSGVSFVVSSLGGDWCKVSSTGTRDTDGLTNTYIEDCVFKKCAGNVDDNSRTVWRHNVFDNGEVGSHGQETSMYGVRQWEFYDNKMLCNPDNPANMQCFLMLRGGTGVITDNEMDDIPWGKVEIQLNVFNIRRRGQIPCQTQYPAARQVGQGWIGQGGYSYPSVPSNGTGYTTDPICIWANVSTAGQPIVVETPDYQPDECGNNQHTADYVKLGRDYLFSAPTAGYTKYPYPHPLRGGGGPGPSPTPTPPQPTPTPTPPQPTPTPSPTPPQPTPTPNGSRYSGWLDELSDWIRQHPATPNQ